MIRGGRSVSKLVCELFVRVLRFCDAWLLGIVMGVGYQDILNGFVKILNDLI